MKAKILLIYTGGTIGMIRNANTGALQPFKFDQLIDEIPELHEFDFKIDTFSFDPVLDSSNMKPEDWVSIAEVIEEKYDNYDGFVILHGTDTMAYTASALSFMFENLGKPVILTGSQLPVGVIRTDGKENVITAIEIAAASANGKPIVPEVCIYFENQLFRGNRSHKFNAEHFEAFRSVNYPALATAGVHINYNCQAIHQAVDQEFRIFKNLNNNVVILKIFPGITADAVRHIFNTPDLKAVVLETYGSGNAPSNDCFLDCLREAISRDIVIYNVTQCRGGAVEMGKYETSKNLTQIGVIGGSDITTEAAITKLMYLIGHGYKGDKLRKYLQTSLRGEMTIR